MNKKKILVKGSYGETNFGDDLLMCVLENFFNEKFPNHDVTFCGAKNKYVSKLLNNSSFTDNIEAEVADVLVYGGGTQFFSFKEERSRIEDLFVSFFNLLINNRKRLLNLILNKLNFNTKNTIALQSSIGIGIGPFINNSRSENLSKLFLKDSKYLAVRDEVSLGYCQKWGLDNAILGADICFSDFLKFDSNFISKPKRISEKKKIGVIVRDWKHEKEGRAYYDSLLEFVKITDNNSEFEIQFIIFAPKKDLEWIDILKGRNVLCWDPNTVTISSFLSQMDEFDAFISSRYHGAIFGLLLGKPVICIEIEPKLKILTEQIKELYLWKKPFDVNELTNLLLSLDYSVQYEKSVNHQKELSNSMFLSFETYLKSVLCEKY